MKKKFLSIFIILTFIIVALLQTNVFASTPKLEEIAEKFNNSSRVKSLEGSDYELAATVNEGNILHIDIKNGKSLTGISYELNGNILSYEHLVDEHLLPTLILADSIGQVNGYKEGELYDTLSSKEAANYTVEKEGFELKENGSYYSVKMDITKKVPLLDLSDFYLEPEEFDVVKKIIDDEEVGNQTGKNLKMSYDIIIGDKENSIYIGEKPETTESTYKSVLSAIEVIYGKKVVEHFESIYPDFTMGNATLDGFTVEIDVDKEGEMFADSKVVLVTIDDEYIKANEKLEEIAEKFNNSSRVKSLKGSDYELTATVSEGNILHIDIQNGKSLTRISYELNGNILSLPPRTEMTTTVRNVKIPIKIETML